MCDTNGILFVVKLVISEHENRLFYMRVYVYGELNVERHKSRISALNEKQLVKTKDINEKMYNYRSVSER